jgi:DNA-binding PadR family transcriptional regulator
MSLDAASTADDLDLTPTAYAVLGMVALRGPSTAYDLKRAFAHLGDQFWSVPHVVHYREAARLEEAGLLGSRQEDGGRRRRTYDVTAAGRRVLARWLDEPARSMEIRDEGELKLLFGELAGPGSLRRLAEDQAEQYRHRLAVLDELERQFADRPNLAPRLAPVAMGRGLFAAARDFWEGMAATLAP